MPLTLHFKQIFFVFYSFFSFFFNSISHQLYFSVYLCSWNSPSTFEEKTEVQKTNRNGLSEEKPTTVPDTNKKDDKSVETERVENNVWWPWKNYDDWLNGRGLKAEQPKKKEEKKIDKEKKNRKKKKKKKKNGKNEKRRKKTKTEKKRPVEIVNTAKVNDDRRPAIDYSYDNEITKKGSIPKIRYNASPIDIIMRNKSLVPALVKYTSRNYTYGMYFRVNKLKLKVKNVEYKYKSKL